ncbi:sensor histidine kinase [Paenibacillus polymyxa]|uniref:sensor histidine kinase n=1 Tax=Paenibacillus TaxID=44249 RepID=UPI0008915E0A|nr:MULTISPECIES: HAMP domain-containing sensor histidine kinase [Paenibacillus]TDL64613.1 HAMP domain-containing sensor histidine kinase [Paenibacillus amylolyticus]WJM09738.1 HAMP domain-containing sensor histidine kinase [Paenibacillus sp. PK1-4R]SDC97392.1 His Kinase A (phospho-acceptor) domain-containing protein [Paenibacillus sp. CF095]
MNSKLINTVRWKFIYAFLLSGILTAVILYGGSQVGQTILEAQAYPDYSIPAQGIRWLVNNIGSVPLMIVVGVLGFVLFFFLFSRKVMRVLDEITAGIQEVAKGELSHRIEVKTSDEFGVVAASINQMAEQLQLSLQEERNAVAAKNDLITGISHDLRTPLTSILGFLEYIEKDRYQDEIEMRYYVSIAYEKSLTLRKLIDDLFEYTRVSGGSLPLSLQALNLNSFLMQLAEEFTPMLEDAGMTYKIIGGQEPLWIQAAPGELVRAYENLFSNAIRYGSQGKLMEIGLALEGDEAVVRISNYGEPIPAQDLPHLFDRFYRVDKSRSRETGGTGLGLAIAKSMIELHRGSIVAYSEKGRTDFVTRFPVTAAPPSNYEE